MQLNSWESTEVAPRASLRALPTIRVHPELDGRTLDIVHSLTAVIGSVGTKFSQSTSLVVEASKNKLSLCVNGNLLI